MIVILEGPDCAGKSTLAERAFGDLHYAHLSAPKGDPATEIAAIVDATPRPSVFDRLHLSEQVYGPVYRDGALEPLAFHLIERWLKANQAVVVLCLPPLAVGLQAWQARREREMYDQDYAKVWAGYKQVKTSLPLVTYDFTWNTPEATRNLVEAVRPRRPCGHCPSAYDQPLTEYLNESLAR